MRGTALFKQDSCASVIYYFCSVFQAAFFGVMLILWGQRKQRKESACRSDKTGVRRTTNIFFFFSLSLRSVFFTDQKSIKGEFLWELFKQCNISLEIIANSFTFVAQV